jgi:hypothetical protein
LGRLCIKRNIARRAVIHLALAGQSIIADSIRHRQHQQCASVICATPPGDFFEYLSSSL